MLEVNNIMLSNTLNIFKYVMENPNEAIGLISNNSNNPMAKQLYDFFINIMNPNKKILKASKKRKRNKKRKGKKSLKRGGAEPSISENSANIIIIIGCILYIYIAFGWISTSVITGLGIGFIALSNVGNQPTILHSNNRNNQFNQNESVGKDYIFKKFEENVLEKSWQKHLNPSKLNINNQNERVGKDYIFKKFEENVLSRPSSRRL